jgi:SAM-dependent methyltransferase
MIQDATDQYIATILAHYPLAGKKVLEIGCGGGRITRDLARYATSVLATDPDGKALAKARAAVTAENVTFRQAPSGVPEDLPPASFDLVIYTLSLHHVPIGAMTASLEAAGRLLRPGGAIMVLEPGAEGPFMEAKQRFGIGSGDESREQAAALAALEELTGWRIGPTIHFETAFLFSDEADFFASKVPNHDQLPAERLAEIRTFLTPYKTAEGIVLRGGRRLNVLTRS